VANEDAELARLHAEWWELERKVRGVLGEDIEATWSKPGRPIPGPRESAAKEAGRVEESARKAESARERYNETLLLHRGAE
jgi:hypothetical protein